MSVRNLCILLSSLSLSVFVSIALARVYIGQRHGLMRLWRHCRLLSRCRRCRWVGALLQRPIYKICTYVHMYPKVATWVEKSRIELSRVESSPVESSLTHFRIVLQGDCISRKAATATETKTETETAMGEVQCKVENRNGISSWGSWAHYMYCMYLTWAKCVCACFSLSGQGNVSLSP